MDYSGLNDPKPKINTTQNSIITDAKQGIQYVVEQSEGIILSLVLMGALFMLYLKSPLYEQRQKEQELIRDNHRKLTENYEGVTKTLLENRQEILNTKLAIEKVHDRLVRLEERLLDASESESKEIQNDIRDLRNMLETIRTLYQSRKYLE